MTAHVYHSAIASLKAMLVSLSRDQTPLCVLE